jgi:hypothetical protein
MSTDNVIRKGSDKLGPERLDIFALGKDFGVWHKAWAQRWHPSQTGWEPLNGSFL